MRQEQQPTNDRMKDVLASMPHRSRQAETDPDRQHANTLVDEAESELKGIAALVHTLVAQLPAESAAQRALAICARLLPDMRTVRLFGLRDGSAARLMLVGEVTRPDTHADKNADKTGTASAYHLRIATRDTFTTLGLGDEVDACVLRRQQEYIGDSSRAVPLVTVDGVLVGALVLLGQAQAQYHPAMIGTCADTLAVLLERLRQERLALRIERALDAIPALAAPRSDDADGHETSRRALEVVEELAQPAAALLLVCTAEGVLRLWSDGSDGSNGDGPPLLESTRSAELLGALRAERYVVLSANDSADLWRSLTMLRERAKKLGRTEPERFMLLPIRTDGTVTAVLALASEAESWENGNWQPVALAVTAAAEAGLRTLHLRKEVAAEGQARDEYISLAGHELRSPLTSIKGYAQLLARQTRKTPLPESMLRSVDAIEQQSLRMSEMVGELLDASRILRGRLEIHPSPVELLPIATKVVERRRRYHPQHVIKLEVQADSSLTGNWDAQRVEQILRDLLDNAARFSPEGGVITLRITRENGDAVVRVTDTGIGIEEVDRVRIFDYLYRAPTAEQRNLSGLGLGLFVSRDLADRMGGELVLSETHTGKSTGSVFELTLPLG